MDKDNLIDDIIEQRVYDIEEFYLKYKDCLDNKTKKNIQTFLTNMTENDIYIENQRTKIKVIVYNNKDAVSI